VLGLPGMFKTYLGKMLSAHFEKISLPCHIVEFDDTEHLDQQLEAILTPKNTSDKNTLLEHFYLDGSFDSGSIYTIVKTIRHRGDPHYHYKFIIIKDQPEDNFVCDNSNEYPFRLETLVMSYYGQHSHKVNSSRLQEKASNLKKVTEKLIANANFNDAIAKLNLQQESFPFSRKAKIEDI
jgi:hypothetical protein